MKNCGNQELVELEATKLCQIWYVCAAHFTNDQFWNNCKKTLVRNAVPTLFTASPLTEEEMAKFPVSQDSEKLCK